MRTTNKHESYHNEIFINPYFLEDKQPDVKESTSETWATGRFAA
jgi:hypothetical protein